MINLEDYLAVVAAYIQRDGYVKSAYQDPTWEKAFVRYDTPIKSDNIIVGRQEHDIARKTIFYFLDQIDSTNDYVNKIRDIFIGVIKKGKQLERRELPFVASAVQSYLKNKEYEKKKKEAEYIRHKESMRSRYVGEIGDKITIQVAKMSSKDISTAYGDSTIYKFEDPRGNIFIWFTGTYVPDNISELTGTVKAHNEFQEVKQTVLTRCKFK